MSGKVGASDTRATVVSEICGRLIAGESVAAIFREPGDRYPHFTTFWRWLRDNPEFDSQVSEAQLAGKITPEWRAAYEAGAKPIEG